MNTLFEKIGRLMLIVSHVIYNISIGRIDNKLPVWELEYHLSKRVLPTFMKPLIRSLFNQSRPYLGVLRQSLVRLHNPCGLDCARAVSEHCWPLAWCRLTWLPALGFLRTLSSSLWHLPWFPVPRCFPRPYYCWCNKIQLCHQQWPVGRRKTCDYLEADC